MGNRRQRSSSAAAQHRIIPNVGHNLPQEDPTAFAAAVWELASKKR
jgi:pimeloyl-ACP methyl ester carboxylesterase